MHPTYWLFVAVVVTVATSRLIRLWTYDEFPPVVWLRDKAADIFDAVAPKWAMLTYCPWCCGFWIALAVIGLGFGLDVYPWTGIESLWWLIMGALASSYLAAMLMVRDGEDDEDDKTAESDFESAAGGK